LAFLPRLNQAQIVRHQAGTERVQLIPNGDFQFQGPLVGDYQRQPLEQIGDMYASAGSNTVPVNGQRGGEGPRDGGAAVQRLQSVVSLEPAHRLRFQRVFVEYGQRGQTTSTRSLT